MPGSLVLPVDHCPLLEGLNLVTTINVGEEPLSVEGRIIGMLLRLVGLATFGFVTASIASLFIGEWMNEELLDARVRGEAEAIARLADEVE